MQSGEVASHRTGAFALGLSVVVIWGISFVATRVGVADIPPVTLALLRFALALAVLWPVLRRSLRAAPTAPGDGRAFVLLGLTGVTLAFLFENVGLVYTTASHASLIAATAPLATALADAAVARRRPSGRMWSGLVLAFVGVATIVGQSHGGATLRGDLLMLASVVVWVVYSFLTRRMAEAYPASVVAYRTILWGVATLTPLAVVELALVGPPRPSSASLAALAFLGIFCSAIAYLWWARALQVLGVTTANSLVYGIPLVAVAAGVVLLDEPLTARVVGGGLLVVAGVVLANLPFGGVGAPRRPLPG